MLLMHLDVSEDVAEALYLKHCRLSEAGMPSMLLLVGLIRSFGGREADIHTALRKGFSSGKPNFVSNSALAIQFWLYSAGLSLAPRPPTDLIREIGVILATRRIDALGDALWVAEWVFSDGEPIDQETIRDLALEGLASLVDELAYGREVQQDVDVPLLRWRCVCLARAMHNAGCNDTSVTEWLTAAQDDPLPEVRYKVSDLVVK